MGHHLVYLCFARVEDARGNNIFEGSYIVSGWTPRTMMQWFTMEHHYVGSMAIEENTVPVVQFLNADIEMETIFLLDKLQPGTGAARWDWIFLRHPV